MPTITCETTHHQYPLTIQTDCTLDNTIASTCRNLANRFVFICDERIIEQYAKPILNQFQHHDLACDLISITSGEEHKTRETKQRIEDQMLTLRCGRDTAIIAVGGGVTTDIAGFVAATYCRGIPIVLIPTTLLAMVDASIGGKTAVNTPQGKNLIGSFHPPAQVFCDPRVLQTCQQDQLLDGLAETIKHALISDATFFNELSDKLNQSTVASFTTDTWEWLIEKSTRIKNSIVKQDSLEKKGPRQLLNFGHTIAHSIETHTNYQFSHGQAVMIGVLVESHLSFLTSHLTQPELNQIKSLLSQFTYNNQIRLTKNDIPSLLSHMQLDKKTVNKKPHFVLLNSIGQAKIEGDAHSFPCSQTDIRISLTDTFKETAL